MVSGGIPAPSPEGWIGLHSMVGGAGTREKGWLEQGRPGTFDLQLPGPGECQMLGARPLVVGGGSEAPRRGASEGSGFPSQKDNPGPNLCPPPILLHP